MKIVKNKLQKYLSKKLVREGGKKIFNKNMGLADPIPNEGIKKAVEILKKSDLYRYGTPSTEVSETTQLEKDFAKYTGAKYALAVNSCSSAIFLSLISSGIKPGDEVLVPAVTFTAVPSAIINAGAIPVLIECMESYQIDIEDFKSKISNKTKALLISHMRGHVSDMDEILKICKQNNLILLEDAAHSLGTLWKGKQTGTIGKAGSYSFQSHKIINSGEGGMLVTNDEEIAVKATIYSGAFENWWKKHQIQSDLFPKYLKVLPIYNLRMSNVTAALIRPQIKLVEKKTKIYIKNYLLMSEILSTYKNITVPKRDKRERMSPDTIQFNIHGFSKQELALFMEIMKEEGLSIYAFGADEGNVRVYTNWKYLGKIPNLPITKNFLKTACDLRLPVFLTEKDIYMIGGMIINILDYITAKRKFNLD